MAQGDKKQNTHTSYKLTGHVLFKCIERVCVCMLKKKKNIKQDTSFIHHLFVILEERSTGPNDSIVKQ